MPLYGLSILEMRHLIECAFLHIRCKCRLSDTGASALTIEIFSSDNDSTELLITAIDIDTLNTSRDIANMVAEIRYVLHNKNQTQPISRRLS